MAAKTAPKTHIASTYQPSHLSAGRVMVPCAACFVPAERVVNHKAGEVPTCKTCAKYV